MTRSSTSRTKDRSKDYSPSASADDARPDDLTASAASPGSAIETHDTPVPTNLHARRADAETPRTIAVPDEYAGERLDKVMARLFPEFSRSRLPTWIDAQRVVFQGAPPKILQPVPPGATIPLIPDLLPEQLAFTAEPVPLNIVYEDDALVVVNKPAGMVVHPAAGNWSGTLLNGLLYRYGEAAAGLPRAGIVHRLDKETSGLMVVARTLEAQTVLTRQLPARTVKRRYVALVWGTMPDEGTIDAPIGRDPRDRTRMAVVESASGKYARTHYRTIDRAMWNQQPVSAVHCDLDTGRTHQIRVHCAHIRHPLLGDPIYGHARGKRSVQPLPAGFNRKALHAWRLGLIHPTTGREISWRADVPADIEALAAELGLGRDESTDLDPEDEDFIEEEGYDAKARAWDESQPIEYDEDDDEE